MSVGLTLQASSLLSISGNTVYLASGFNVVQISGQTVNIAGTITASTNISGQTVYLVNDQINNVVWISGQNTVEFGAGITANVDTQCTSLSGGTELYSGVIFSVSIVNLSGNQPVRVGGTGTNSPNSGRGIILYAGAAWDVRVNNLNQVRVYASRSGEFVSWAAVRQ